MEHKFCTKCGTQLRLGSVFCEKCGNPVTTAPAPVCEPALEIVAVPEPSQSYEKADILSKKIEELDSSDNAAGVAASMLVVAIGILMLAGNRNTFGLILFGVGCLVYLISLIIYISAIANVIPAYKEYKQSGETPPADVVSKISPKAIFKKGLMGSVGMISNSVFVVALIVHLLSYSFDNEDIKRIKEFERYESITIADVIDEYIDSPKWSSKYDTVDISVDVIIIGKFLGDDIEIIYSNNDYHISLKKVTLDGDEATGDKADQFEALLFLAYDEGYNNFKDYMEDNGFAYKNLKRELF